MQEQASFDEILDGVVHAYAGMHTTGDGYRGVCACGWVSEWSPTHPEAWVRWRSHLGRTPQARALGYIVRRPGRFSHD